MGRAFEYRKATKFARWDKMSKQFTKMGREIFIAVKQGGPLPETNPALRRAIKNAKGVSMPKDRIEAAIKRASSKDSANLEELTYEGYGPYGVAVIVETATDNPVRTVANVRAAFNKNSGSLGTSGSVSYMFDRKGVFKIPKANYNTEELELQLIDFGLDSMEFDEENIICYCAYDDFGNFTKGLEELNIEALSQELQWLPQVPKELTEEQVDEVLELIDRLEQDDDVQNVYHNLA